MGRGEGHETIKRRGPDSTSISEQTHIQLLYGRLVYLLIVSIIHNKFMADLRDVQEISFFFIHHTDFYAADQYGPAVVNVNVSGRFSHSAVHMFFSIEQQQKKYMRRTRKEDLALSRHGREVWYYGHGCISWLLLVEGGGDIFPTFGDLKANFITSRTLDSPVNCYIQF